MTQQAEYIPGVCNINTSEVRRRRTIGFTGLGIVIVVATMLAMLDAPAWWGVVLFVPAFLATTGFLQAKHKFCVGYAGAGMRHTGTEAEHIEDADAVAIDKRRARTMNLQAFGGAVVVTLLGMVILQLV